jgi:hypothetical protein
MVDFEFSGTPFTVVSVYAPTAYCHILEDHQVLLGGDLNCIT